MPSRITNQLAVIRRSRGIGAADLARRVGVSRQTIYAIEAGSYTPNTELALGLARELEVSVEQLFSLATETQAAPDTIASEVLSAHTPEKGDPVRVGKVGSRWVSVPVSAAPYYLPEADGVIAHLGQRRSKANVLIPSRDGISEKRLVLAGCDPASSLLVHMVEQTSGVEVVSAAASSKLALDWLRAGKVHVAGSHLKDDRTGEFNLPYIRREFREGDFTVVTFARWEEGLVVAKSNPKGVRRVQDLAKRGVRFVNRELGSGSRALLDRLLRDAGVPASRVDGYERVVRGHLAAAYCVASGDADSCLATRSAAQTFNLAFTPLESERYDLVMRKRTLDTPEAQALLDVLQRATLRRKLEAVAGYDTAETGTIVA
jgi:molybdate-binding protein/DNA-binding XRE family transcriptional regulator